jgi:diketogulonate reductase-like aldo/keto reductase
MNNPADTFILNNGVGIPCLGFGTWQTPSGRVCVDSVKYAIETGYVHIDTAAAYGNERDVGTAIKESGADRKKIFITTKLWNSERGYDKTMKAFEKSLKLLQLDYLDLYLIHWPATARRDANWQKTNISTWKAFEELYKDGRIRAIGVSNFLPHHLQPLIDKAEIKPMVNQIELHVGQMQQETVAFCRQHGIVLEAWSPLGSGRMISNPTLKGMAQKYGVSVAQLCIRWCLQNEFLPLPKSVTPSRIKENADVFGFEISEEDMAFLNGMEYIGGSGLNPDEVWF